MKEVIISYLPSFTAIIGCVLTCLSVFKRVKEIVGSKEVENLELKKANKNLIKSNNELRDQLVKVIRALNKVKDSKEK